MVWVVWLLIESVDMTSLLKTLFSIGFRPFFLSAALFVSVCLFAWVGLYGGMVDTGGPMDSLRWHAHEMIFGYLGAVLAGFTLTAVANWTGRPPVSGGWLITLFLLWLAGRAAMALSLAGDLPVSTAGLIDVGFIPAFIGLFAREVIAGGNKRNLVVVAAVSVFGLANVLFCIDVLGLYENALWIRLGLGTLALLLALIGGRIIPAFTGNWLKAQKLDASMPVMGLIDKVSILLVGVGALGWTLFPEQPVTGGLWMGAGGALLLRLRRWRGLQTGGEPLIVCLHIAYGFLAFSLIVIGLNVLFPADVPISSGLHLLSAGAIGLMTMVVMCRALLGHTGRPISSTPFLTTALGLVLLGGVLRVLAPWLPAYYGVLISISGFMWGGGFFLFACSVAPMVIRPRV